MLERLKRFGWGYLALGTAIIATGVCFIAFQNALNVLAISVGIILALYGIFFGVLTLSKRSRGIGFALKIAVSVISIVCGITTAVMQDGAILLIKDIFCLLMIVDGSFKLTTAIQATRYKLIFRWFLLPIAIITIVASFLLAKNAGAEISTLSLLLGIVILCDGALNIISPFAISGIKKKESAEI